MAFLLAFSPKMYIDIAVVSSLRIHLATIIVYSNNPMS